MVCWWCRLLSKSSGIDDDSNSLRRMSSRTLNSSSHYSHTTSFVLGVITGGVITTSSTTVLFLWWCRYRRTRRTSSSSFNDSNNTHDEIEKTKDHIQQQFVRNVEGNDKDDTTGRVTRRRITITSLSSTSSSPRSVPAPVAASPATQPVVMDSPLLDLRLIRKAEAVIRMRTSCCIIVIERCTNDHNYSAILRTAEALGIQHVWIIDPPAAPAVVVTAPALSSINDNITLLGDEEEVQDSSDNDDNGENDDVQHGTTTLLVQEQQQQKHHEQIEQQNQLHQPSIPVVPTSFSWSETNDKLSTHTPVIRLTPQEIKERQKHRLFAQNATEWLTIREFTTTSECIHALQESKYHIWVTDLSQQAIPLTQDHLQQASLWPLPDRIAIVFGTEAVGCTQAMLDAAHVRVYLPLRGFADSLNLSVATALVIHQLFLLEPTYIGRMFPEEQTQLRQLWFPKLARQRLLGGSNKRQRKKLLQKIADCERLIQKQKLKKNDDTDEIVVVASSSASSTLTREQQIKISQLSQYQAQLKQLEDESCWSNTAAIEASVAEYIQSPPEPLSDLRRADLHRVTFVGKNTKQIHKDHWQDMVAIGNVHPTHLATASFFRERIKGTTTTETGL